MVARYPTLIGILVCIILGFGLEACYSPTLPLPPPARDGLTVSPPDADGFVVVHGEPGVMEAGEQAEIINTRTLYGWIVPVDDDGFEALVTAEAGDTLAIQRRVGEEVGQAIQLVVPSE